MRVFAGRNQAEFTDPAGSQGLRAGSAHVPAVSDIDPVLVPYVLLSAQYAGGGELISTSSRSFLMGRALQCGTVGEQGIILPPPLPLGC